MVARDGWSRQVTVYDRLLQRIDKSMSLLFKLNEFLTSASADFDTQDLMEHAMQARDKLVQYANWITNLMQFCKGPH